MTAEGLQEPSFTRTEHCLKQSNTMVILTEESTSWNHKSLMPHPCECCCRIPTPQDQGFSLCLSEVLRLRGRKSRENTSTKQNTPPQYLLSECSWGMEYPSVSVPFLHFHGHRIMVQRAGFCTLHNHFRPDMGYSDFLPKMLESRDLPKKKGK